MGWYIAKVVFRIIAGNRADNNEFDEHLRLVEASSTVEAVLKARILGLKEEEFFVNTRETNVRLEFINVADVQPLAGVNDGAELYSTIRTQEPSNEYIHYVHLRAAALQTGCPLAIV
jgi:hypothetical protein